MLKNVIINDLEKCAGCNRCIRVCPIEEANIACETNSQIIVKVDNDKCIACGACIIACPHNSRRYDDDTEVFFDDLKKGIKISILVAPAIKTNFNNWGQLLSFLRKLGVVKIFDVSLGADICTWAHIRYLQKNNNEFLISQPCPAIVNYILKHKTNLISNLSPIHSPMLCTAIYMRKYEKINDKIAALSPCIAKTYEFHDTGIVNYNITFHNLCNYIKNNNITLPQDNSGFDSYDSGLGFLYPMPGGLKENVEYYLGKSLRIDKSEGQHTVYKALNEYAQQPKSNLPVLFDVLNCAEGCNQGTGCLNKDISVFKVHTILDNKRQEMIAENTKDYLDKLYEYFDTVLKLSDFLRRYLPTPVKDIPVTQSKIEEAFLKLGKTDDESRNFNCGACGSETCMDMAKKIAKGVNTPLNCLDKAHKDISREHSEAISIQSANIKNLERILADTTTMKSTIEEIVSHMDDVVSSIDSFNKMNEEIKKIVMQINIISVNASIESARAGQYGRAFRVIAEEIRSLANISKASLETSENTSTSAITAVNLINNLTSQISENIHESYNNVTLIFENTMNLLSRGRGC